MAPTITEGVLIQCAGLLASCGPTATPQVAAHDVHLSVAAPHAASQDGAFPEGEAAVTLVPAWSVDIGFGFNSYDRENCRFPVLLVDAEDRVTFAGHDYIPTRGERLHAVFHGDAEGRIERVTLGEGSEPAGPAEAGDADRVLVALVPRKGGVLAAFWVRNGIELTSQPAMGEPPTERRRFVGAKQVWPLSDGRWLIVYGAPNHLVMSLTWPSPTPTRTPRPLLPHLPPHFGHFYDVTSQGSRWAARGSKRIDGDLKSHLAVFDGETFAWSLGEEAFISIDQTFDDDGGLWISAFTYQELWPGLGAARFPKPPSMPIHVKKAEDDESRLTPGHITFADARIWSLFGSALRRVGVSGRRILRTEDITDGLMLRYTPEGQLSAEIRYPGTAIVWPGPLLPEDHGMTVAIHVEGEVPTALRGHPDLPEGFVGATLLAHYDTRGRQVWSAPLGAGERVVRKLAKTSDGYVAITLEESGRCHLSRWRLQRDAPASPSVAGP